MYAAKAKGSEGNRFERRWGARAACIACLAAAPAWAQQDVPLVPIPLPLQQLEPGTPQRLSLSIGSPVGNPPAASSANLDLGLQWRQPLSGEQHVDITAWRRLNPAPDAATLIHLREPVYGARVEMRIKPSKFRPFGEAGFIGMQLDNGAKIMLRRKNGNPTLYYRSSF